MSAPRSDPSFASRSTRRQGEQQPSRQQRHGQHREPQQQAGDHRRRASARCIGIHTGMGGRRRRARCRPRSSKQRRRRARAPPLSPLLHVHEVIPLSRLQFERARCREIREVELSQCVQRGGGRVGRLVHVVVETHELGHLRTDLVQAQLHLHGVVGDLGQRNTKGNRHSKVSRQLSHSPRSLLHSSLFSLLSRAGCVCLLCVCVVSF